MDIIQSILGQDEGNFTVLEEPSETALGQFRVRIDPYCGMELAGCFIELEITYLEVDSTEMIYEILPDSAEGLTDEQLDDLQYELSQNMIEGMSSSIEIISAVQDFLGRENSSTRKVIQYKEAELQEKEIKKRATLLDQQRKQGLRRLQDFEKKQQQLLYEEQKWCESVNVQQNNNSKYRPTNSQHEGQDVKQAAADKSKTTQISVTPTSLNESEETKQQVEMGKGDGDVIDHANKVSRYSNDFEE